MDAARHFWRDPALPYVECRRATDSEACYLPHTHPTLSVGAVDAGCSVFSCDGAETRLSKGDVVVIPPHRAHSCNPAPQGPWSYQMLYLDTAWVGTLLQEMGAADPCVLSQPMVLRDEDSYRDLRATSARLFSDAEPEEKEAALIVFLGALFGRAAPPPAEAPQAVSTRLDRVLAHLDEHHAETVPLDRLAALAGLSRYHFIRAFRAHTGLTPHAY